MKRNITFLALVLLAIFSKAQTTIALDTISVNTVWADTVLLNNNVFINNSIHLKIKPGSVVMATGLYGIQCQGQILANGTEQDSILFTISDTTYFSYADTAIGGWGGISFDETPSTNDSSIFNYCVFEFGKANNTSAELGSGGLLYVFEFSKLRVSNSSLKNSSANYYGGAICLGKSSALIKNNTFYNNSAIYEGGALAVIGKSTSLIINNIFIANQVSKAEIWGTDTIYQGTGSAIYIVSSGSDILLNRVKVISNQFYNNRGNTFYESSIHTLFMNNIMSNNYQEAIYSGGGPFTHSVYTNNTIVNNKNIGTTIEMMDNALFCNNLIISNLNGEEDTWAIINVETGWSNIAANYNNIKFNYIQNGGFDTLGEGNIIGLTPQFINPTTHNEYINDWQDYDWHLQETSPCINMGILDTVGLNLYEFDMDNNPRIFGNRIDIGAYENQTVVSIKEKLTQETNISIYPNPAHNNLQLVINNEQLSENIKILDITGKETNIVCNYKQNQELISIDISTLKAGIYFVKIGETVSKFIKE